MSVHADVALGARSTHYSAVWGTNHNPHDTIEKPTESKPYTPTAQPPQPWDLPVRTNMLPVRSLLGDSHHTSWSLEQDILSRA